MNDYILIASSTITQLALPVLFCIGISILFSSIAALSLLGRKYLIRPMVIACMFSLYGLVLGFMIGASQQSISRDAFSAIVTILSGYFGYAISKDLHSRVKAMIPISVICFLLSMLFSIVYFVKLSKSVA